MIAETCCSEFSDFTQIKMARHLVDPNETFFSANNIYERENRAFVMCDYN